MPCTLPPPISKSRNTESQHVGVRICSLCLILAYALQRRAGLRRKRNRTTAVSVTGLPTNGKERKASDRLILLRALACVGAALSDSPT